MDAQDKPKPGPAERVVSVSVDLDAIGCYYRIHGLAGEPPAAARAAVLRRCLPRFVELFARHGVQATFFVVGADLEDDPEARAALRALAAEGHELANHTQNHPYDFVRLGHAGMAAEIDRAHAAIAELAAAPVGFRAPGYGITSDVVDLLLARGYRYDSSVFPSPPYYAAKALVMAAMRVTGRRSGSLLGSPRAPFAPRAPYTVDGSSPFRPGGAAIIELPIAVTPIARLHVIGTSLILAPPWLRRRLLAACLRAPFFNLELHGIDLCDAAGDGVPSALVARQPDLRRSLAHKLAALDDTLRLARVSGAVFRPLAAAVPWIHGGPGRA
jgi:peptidoglycan-N-acetylglucosamine deacetylase